jgi:Na+-translocating ferredoxin:NAD+ oxidoreductase RnfC subunit
MNEISRLVREAGVAGEGGAGFPSHVKYSSPARLLVINGAECEPLLGTDQYIMAHFAERLVAAALAIQGALGAEKAVFAVKDHYREQIAALKAAIEGKNGLEVCLLESVYPAGDEQVLLYETAGVRVPPGGIPPDSGAVVSNAGTLLAVADALEGKALTHKYLTVSGAVAHPLVLRAPIGTGFSECIEQAGGIKTSRPCIISGGPLMGQPIDNEDLDSQVVTKTTSGIIVLEEGHYLDLRRRVTPLHMKNRAHASCIQCSMCSDLCPRRLLGSPLRPHLVMRAFGSSRNMDELLETKVANNALLCCECGICELYACPMELQPCRINALIKEEFRARGMKPDFSPGEDPSPAWPYRRIPPERMAARAGLSAYYGLTIQGFKDMEQVRRVSIPLKMHAGVPALPCVETGERVEAGSLIADIPQGKLGARIHASIRGRVRRLPDRIVIEAESSDA